MPRTLEELKALPKYDGIDLWTETFKDVTLVCRFPSPDAFDQAFGDMAGFKQTGDGSKLTRACEAIVKASCVSHTPEELDAIRRTSVPKYFPLFVRVGQELFEKLAPEAEEQGKD